MPYPGDLPPMNIHAAFSPDRPLQEEPEDFWPREIPTDRATVVLYQP